jgi:hypothetical protein
MAQIDPNIALQFKQPQIQDPVAAATRVQDFGINALKMSEMQRGIAQENKLRELISSGADLSSPETIRQMYNISPKMGSEFEKNRATIQKEKFGAQKMESEAVDSRLKLSRQLLDGISSPEQYIAWHEANHRDPVLGPMLAARGITADQSRQKIMSALSRPGGLQQLINESKMGVEKFAEQNTMSANQRAQLAQSESQFQRRENKPVFSPDYGGFVVPPSANAPQGSFIPVADVTGAPLQSNKPLTEGQAKGVGFALRAKEADQVLNTIGEKGKVQPGLIKRTLESTPFIGEGLGTTFNFTQSEKQQQVEQAQRNFVNAVLRQESGAVINEDEFNNAKKQYFPQPGDSAAVIKQKEQARKTTIKALETQAGPGLKRAGGGKTEDPLGIR